MTASHLFSSATPTTVTLTLAATPGGSSTYSVSVTPKYVASTPTAVSLTGTSVSGYRVTANYNVSGGVAPYTVKAVWGDGTQTTVSQTSSGADSQSHTYINAGTYTVSIIATDSGANGAYQTTGSALTGVTLASLSISGLVTISTGTTPLPGVSLSLPTQWRDPEADLNGCQRQLYVHERDARELHDSGDQERLHLRLSCCVACRQ